MRSFAVLGVLWLLAAIVPAFGQLQISAQTERTNFLLYENVDLRITLENIGDNDVVLNNDEGHPWLSFLVSRKSGNNYVPLHTERKAAFKSLTLKAGETKTLVVNITPLAAFRDEGEYRAAAIVDLPGQGQIMTSDVPFNVVEGRKVWSQTHVVDGVERVYSLIRFSRTPSSVNLYLRIESPSENLVYANISLGDVVSMIDPEVYFDPSGNLQVLHPCALHTYLYTRLDPDGHVEHQTIFKTYREIPPHLRRLEDGNVVVYGGLEEDPHAPRERLSTGQLGQNSPAAPSTTSSPQ